MQLNRYLFTLAVLFVSLAMASVCIYPLPPVSPLTFLYRLRSAIRLRFAISSLILPLVAHCFCFQVKREPVPEAAAAGQSWKREAGNGQSWKREAGNGQSWKREAGNGQSWKREAGNGQSWKRDDEVEVSLFVFALASGY